MQFEVYRKRGKGYQLLATVRESDSRRAAIHVGYVHGCKSLWVRPADSNAKLIRHKFNSTPFLL